MLVAIFFAFTCIPMLTGGPLRVALVGDPQVDNAIEMGYARKSIYSELANRKDIDLCIFLGDLVNDNMALLPESVRVIDSLPFPCLMIPGNHDRDVYHGPKASHLTESPETQRSERQDVNRPRDLSTWRKIVGYVDTTFVSGKVRFVLMNNVRLANGGMTDYEGGFTDVQKHWLDSVVHVSTDGGRDIASCAAKKEAPALTILATHIPFSQMKGRDSVLALIPDLSRMLFVSGHTHYVSRGYIKNADSDDELTAPELIAGAACGSWWRGVKDANGVPYALQSCGAPRGYFIADIRHNGDYRLTYKCIGRPESEQMSVWAIPEDAETNSKPYHDSALEYRIYVNVFGGAPDGVVKISIPRKVRQRSGRRQMICERSFATATEVEEVVRFNASMSREYRKAHRDEFIPLRRKPSQHLWKSAEPFEGYFPTYVNVHYQDSHMIIHSVRVPVQTFPEAI